MLEISLIRSEIHLVLCFMLGCVTCGGCGEVEDETPDLLEQSDC